MTLRRALPWITLAAVAVFVGWKLRTSHFDWAGFGKSVRAADWRFLLASLTVIYAGNVLRAVRWAVFLRQPGIWWTLVASQFVGFTGLAIFGRVGELIRPWLVARRTGLTFPSQVAVVAVERVFDLGALGVLFGSNLALSPSLSALPYHERFRQVGYAIAALTLVIGLFVVGVRVAGAAVGRGMGRVAGSISVRFGASVEERVLAFQDGIRVIATVSEFALVAGLSLVLWASVAVAYWLVLQAFPVPVSAMTMADTILLLGFSAVGGIVQLPGVGGGAQVGTITSLTLLFGVPAELAVSAGLVLWLITSMGVVPAGLVLARVEGLTLGEVARGGGEGGEGCLMGLSNLSSRQVSRQPNADTFARLSLAKCGTAFPSSGVASKTR